MKRRDFIFRTGSSIGAIMTPWWVEKAANFIDKNGEPFLIKPGLQKPFIMNVNEGSGALYAEVDVDELLFNVYDPDWDGFFMSYKNYFETMSFDYRNPRILKKLKIVYGFDSMDEPYVSHGAYLDSDAFGMYDNAIAILNYLELGNIPVKRHDLIGQIRYEEVAGGMGSGFWTEAILETPMDISCLQKRFNELGANILIEIS